MTSAELLAIAAIESGKYAQAFPNFGPERRGAPVKAFIRIDDKPIRTRFMIYEPDLVMVLDPSILHLSDITSGLKKDGVLISNSKYNGKDLQKELGISNSVAAVNANEIAYEELGVPITNTTMLGALLKVREVVALDSLKIPFEKRFGRLAEKNINALHRAYKDVSIEPSR